MGTRLAQAGSFWQVPRSRKQKNGSGRHWQPDPPRMLLLAKKLVNKHLLGNGGAAGLHAQHVHARRQPSHIEAGLPTGGG
jgi:hypothetical protein